MVITWQSGGNQWAHGRRLRRGGARGACEARSLARELRHLARAHVHTANINTFFFHPKLPVDVRHNAKIHRLELAQWANTAKGFESDPKR